jgi:hypothetical protein
MTRFLVIRFAAGNAVPVKAGVESTYCCCPAAGHHQRVRRDVQEPPALTGLGGGVEVTAAVIIHLLLLLLLKAVGQGHQSCASVEGLDSAGGGGELLATPGRLTRLTICIYMRRGKSAVKQDRIKKSQRFDDK